MRLWIQDRQSVTGVRAAVALMGGAILVLVLTALPCQAGFVGPANTFPTSRHSLAITLPSLGVNLDKEKWLWGAR